MKWSLKSVTAAVTVVGAGFVFDAGSNDAQAGCSSDPFLGSICATAATFCPSPNYTMAAGQIIDIAQNQALFSLLGTTYGGDGRTTLQLPDLRGRSAIGAGGAPGLSSVRLGQKRGMERVQPDVLTMVGHSHEATFVASGTGGGAAQIKVSTVDGTKPTPGAGDYLGVVKSGAIAVKAYVPAAVAGEGVILGGVTGGGGGGGTVTVANTGGGQLEYNLPPQLGLTYCIAINGTFPSRP